MRTYVVEFSVKCTQTVFVENCKSKAEAMRRVKEDREVIPNSFDVDYNLWSTMEVTELPALERKP